MKSSSMTPYMHYMHEVLQHFMHMIQSQHPQSKGGGGGQGQFLSSSLGISKYGSEHPGKYDYRTRVIRALS